MSNKPVKSTSIGDVIAGQPAQPAQPKARAKSVKKGASPVQSAPRSTGTYSDSIAGRIQAAAKSRAQADAAAIRQYGQQVYERELALEVQRLMGGDVEDYFRFDTEGLSLPQPATAGYLQTVEVSALPSAN